MSLQVLAQNLQSKGQGNDSILMHMTPNEVNSLQGLAVANGGGLTINPETGLLEAGFLDSILPMIAGAALSVALPGVSPWLISAGVGGVTGLLTGDLGQGIKAGLGAYGGTKIPGMFGAEAVGAGAGNTVAGATHDAATNALSKTPLSSSAGQVFAQNAGTVMAPQAAAVQAASGMAPFASQGVTGAMGQSGANTGLAQVPLMNQGNNINGVQQQVPPPQSWLQQNKWPVIAGVAGLGAGAMLAQPTGEVAEEEEDKYPYEGPYIAADRTYNPIPFDRIMDSREFNHFDEVNPYPSYRTAASGGLVSFSDGGGIDPSSIFGGQNHNNMIYSNNPFFNAGVSKNLTIHNNMGEEDEGYVENKTPTEINYTVNPFLKRALARTGGGAGAGAGAGGTPEEAPDFTLAERYNQSKHRLSNIDLQGFAHGGIANRGIGRLGGSMFQKRNFGARGLEAFGATNSPVNPYGARANEQLAITNNPGYRMYPAGMYPGAEEGQAYMDSIEGIEPGMAQAVSGGERPTNLQDTEGFGGAQQLFGGAPMIDQLPPHMLHPTNVGTQNMPPPPQTPGGKGIGSTAPATSQQQYTQNLATAYQNIPGSTAPPPQTPGGKGSTAVPGGKGSYAHGGPVQMDDGAFILDANTVSSIGNGSSGAGQDVLSQFGGVAIQGAGDGVSDSIPAIVDGSEDILVARDEVMFSPEVVARLGGGDAEKGAQQLYGLMDEATAVRKKTSRGEPNGLSRGLASAGGLMKYAGGGAARHVGGLAANLAGYGTAASLAGAPFLIGDLLGPDKREVSYNTGVNKNKESRGRIVTKTRGSLARQPLGKVEWVDNPNSKNQGTTVGTGKPGGKRAKIRAQQEARHPGLRNQGIGGTAPVTSPQLASMTNQLPGSTVPATSPQQYGQNIAAVYQNIPGSTAVPGGKGSTAVPGGKGSYAEGGSLNEAMMPPTAHLEPMLNDASGLGGSMNEAMMPPNIREEGLPKELERAKEYFKNKKVEELSQEELSAIRWFGDKYDFRNIWAYLGLGGDMSKLSEDQRSRAHDNAREGALGLFR